MALELYSPWRTLYPTRSLLSDWFGDRWFDLAEKEEKLMGKGFYPVVDINETDEAIKVRAELPGMSEKDIKVEFTDDVLTLKGEKKKEEKVDNKGYHLEETVYGSFQRSFRMPTNVDAEKIHAEFKKGVLEILVPKAEEVKPKQIEIKIH